MIEQCAWCKKTPETSTNSQNVVRHTCGSGKEYILPIKTWNDYNAQIKKSISSNAAIESNG